MSLRFKKSLFIFILIFSFSLTLTCVAGQTNLEDFEGEFNQAPEFKEKVEAGELPSIEDRLPEKPVVVEPHEKIGRYGGSWRNIYYKSGDDSTVAENSFFVRLVKAKPMMKGFEPDLCDWWEVSEDNTTYTFHIREGLKWSDGHPFTTEDIMFWYNHILLNDELRPYKPDHYKVGGEVAQFEKIDDYTFKIIFSEPFGKFIEYHNYATPYHEGYRITNSPKHYLKNFHPAFVSEEELQEKIEEADLDEWTMLFNDQKADAVVNKELPTMGPWNLSEGPLNDRYQKWSRNPYYYKVDPEGNQLPYMDHVEWPAYSEPEQWEMQGISGNVDFHCRNFEVPQISVLKNNEEKGNYEVIQYKCLKGSDPAIHFNLTYEKDPVLRDIFRKVKFRRAVSLAINRKDIQDAYFFGLGEAQQAAVGPSSSFYDPEWANAYAEFKPEKARNLLDEVGLDEKNKDGIRLRSDGEPLEIVFVHDEEVAGISEMVADDLEDVGIKIHDKQVNRTLLFNMVEGNEHQLTHWSFAATFINTGPMVPQGGASMDTAWGKLWGDWLRSDGETGEKPPQEILRLAELEEKVMATADREDSIEYLEEMASIHKENLYAIGIVGLLPRVGIKHNRMKNIPGKEDINYTTWQIMPMPSANAYPETWYIDPDISK